MLKPKKTKYKITFQKYIPFLLLSVFLLITSIIYFQRIGSFSFGDEWNIWIAADFMMNGRKLYESIFYNHQMLMAYVSFLLQFIFHPKTIYQLVLLHRVFMIAFSALFSILLFIRFGYKIIGFLVIYEITKYYVFGHLFLPESLIVYITVYLFLITKEKINTIKIPEFIVITVFTWFIIFLREPYTVIALTLYGVILFKLKDMRMRVISFICLALLSLLVIVAHNMHEYIYQVVIFNSKYVLPYEASTNLSSFNILKVIFYPFYILLANTWTYFGQVLIVVSSIFTVLLVNLIAKKQYSSVLYVFIILALAAVRFTEPGKMFYESFHMSVWYGLFLAITSMNFYISMQNRMLNKYFIAISLFSIVMVLMWSHSFLWEKTNKIAEFNTNYAHYFVIGEVIGSLASPTDTLFADQWDYLIHFTSHVPSSYKYGLFSFVMAHVDVYDKSRKEMFENNSPTFYYTYCNKGVYYPDLFPKEKLSIYQQLSKEGKPSCVLIKKSKIATISQDQWNEIKKYNYAKPLD